MKRFKIIILLIATFVLLCACLDKGEGHSYITFANNSNKEIVCQAFVSGSITGSDTLFQCRTGARSISSISSCNFSSLHDSWETDFQAIPYIQFLVMDAETYDKYISEPCDTIRKYVPILHCYRLKLEDLQRMKWKVVCPIE